VAPDVEELWREIGIDPAMIEPLLCGIVLGLIPVTLLGLFMAAWNQYRRGSLLDS
jgi:cytochrome b6-f complex subunit 5